MLTTDVSPVNPLIAGLVSVLFVSVSVVALPTSVSVEVGRVSVPVLVMLLITGVVSVADVSSTTLPVPVLSEMAVPLILKTLPVPAVS